MSAEPGERAAAFICRCEELTAGDVRQAIMAGARTINDVKRRTRAGMGNCQGVYCLNHVADLIASDREISREAVTPMTSRPVARVITLESLANLYRNEE